MHEFLKVLRTISLRIFIEKVWHWIWIGNIDMGVYYVLHFVRESRMSDEEIMF